MAFTTSGTYNFSTAASLGSLSAYALARCGVMRSEITSEHLTNVGTASNLILQDWGSDTPNLWKMVLQTVPLVQGMTQYALPANVVLVTDCYITTNQGSPPPQDRVIFPVSRTTYASFPNKLLQSFPTTWWFDRVLPPQIFIYPAPDGNGPYTLSYWSMLQAEDALVSSGTTLDLPGKFLMPFVDALSAEMAVIYKPALATALDEKAQRSIEKARMADREDVTYSLAPGLGAYYRQ